MDFWTTCELWVYNKKKFLKDLLIYVDALEAKKI
jgi:hypothetical protein